MNRVGGDPWDGRSLEWSTSAPPPAYNFAALPVVSTRDAWWEEKHGDTKIDWQQNLQQGETLLEVRMPRNTGIGIMIGACAFAAGFGIVWHVWWLAILGLLGAIACVFVRAFQEDIEYVVEL